MEDTFTGPDGKSRCFWCSATEEYIHYHDNEWGYPVADDFDLFEKLSLESFQSGLSWRTILAKRDNFRKAFRGFDFNKVARFSERDVGRLLQDEGIVRHRGKIEATINNAKCAKLMIKEAGSLGAFFWSFEPQSARPAGALISSSTESIALSKALKKLGWKFVGPTTAYAFMQATGQVNDHAAGCVSWKKISQARNEFKRPQ
jgi:DNA-3-methyladenine glycosylase I